MQLQNWILFHSYNFDCHLISSAGLYPLLHINKDGAVIGRLEDSDDFLDSTALGEQLVVDQGA